jgi:hypothetical protein
MSVIQAQSKKSLSTITAIYTSSGHILRANSLQRLCKRQLVAIRIEHVEITFPTRRVPRNFRIKSFLQMCPERTHILSVEGRPAPPGTQCHLVRGLGSQIPNRSLAVKRNSPVLRRRALHAEHISTKLHRSLHVQNPRSNRGLSASYASSIRRIYSLERTVKVEADPGTGLESSHSHSEAGGGLYAPL